VQGHVVSLERACELSADHYGVQPSDGAVQNWVIKAGQFLGGDYAANRQSIRAAAVAHCDASGMRSGGQRNGLPVAATEQSVYYTVPAKRGQEAMDGGGYLTPVPGQRGSRSLAIVLVLHPVRSLAVQCPSPAGIALLPRVERPVLAWRTAPPPGGRQRGSGRRPCGRPNGGRARPSAGVAGPL